MRAGRKRAKPAGDDHDASVEFGSVTGLDVEAAVRRVSERRDRLAEMEFRRERTDLLREALDQFTRTADRHCRDVVDRLVRIQFDALAADPRHRIDDVRVESEQAQLEHLEQADRTSPDDDGVAMEHGKRSLDGRREAWGKSGSAI